MKYKQILSFFAGACLMFSSLQAQEYNLTKFPKGSTPLEVGNRIANKFIVTPHTRFGNPGRRKLLIISRIPTLVRGWVLFGLVKLPKTNLYLINLKIVLNLFSPQSRRCFPV